MNYGLKFQENLSRSSGINTQTDERKTPRHHTPGISILSYNFARGITDDFTTIPFHLLRVETCFQLPLLCWQKFIPDRFNIVFPPLLQSTYASFFPFTMACRIVFAKPEDLEIWRNHPSFRFSTMIRNSSYFPMAACIFLRTYPLLVTWLV